MGEVIQWNCPLFGMVNAVRGVDAGSSFIYQNPEVRSSIEKMDELALPMSLMHSLISFMKYLSNVRVLVELPEILDNSESLALLLGDTEYW
jgi:hypothetical protein